MPADVIYVECFCSGLKIVHDLHSPTYIYIYIYISIYIHIYIHISICIHSWANCVPVHNPLADKLYRLGLLSKPVGPAVHMQHKVVKEARADPDKKDLGNTYVFRLIMFME